MCLSNSGQVHLVEHLSNGNRLSKDPAEEAVSHLKECEECREKFKSLFQENEGSIKKHLEPETFTQLKKVFNF